VAAGVGVGSAGAGVVPEVPVGVGAAVGSVAPAVERVGLAALAALLGSSLLVEGDFGVDVVPAAPAPIAAANAVICVRTS
jgi:hypothetical protein